MNIAMTKKLGFMAGIVRTGVFLLTVLSSVLMLSACSINPERHSETVSAQDSTIAVSKPSAVEPESKEGVATSASKKSKTVVKPVTKKRTPKPYTGTKVVKKIYKEPVKKKTIVSKKPSVHMVEKKNTKKAIVAKKAIEKEMVVDQVESTKQLAKVSNFEDPKYKVDLAKLPLLIGTHWTLSRDADTDEQCALSYRKVVMNDGQGETPVFVIITQDKVLFKTKSNIDVTYKQTGLTIDDLPQLPIEKLYNDFSISYKLQYQALVDRMKVGEQAVLTLGFWPSWPVTQTYSIKLALGEFSAAQQALMTCVELEKELK